VDCTTTNQSGGEVVVFLCVLCPTTNRKQAVNNATTTKSRQKSARNCHHGRDDQQPAARACSQGRAVLLAVWAANGHSARCQQRKQRARTVHAVTTTTCTRDSHSSVTVGFDTKRERERAGETLSMAAARQGQTGTSSEPRTPSSRANKGAHVEQPQRTLPVLFSSSSSSSSSSFLTSFLLLLRSSAPPPVPPPPPPPPPPLFICPCVRTSFCLSVLVPFPCLPACGCLLAWLVG